MSRANMTFIFDDGTVLCGIYNGTMDRAWNFMVESRDDAWARYREGYHGKPHRFFSDETILHPECTCGEEPESVVAKSDYGGGFEWNGTACRKCMVFIGPCDPHEREESSDRGFD